VKRTARRPPIRAISAGPNWLDLRKEQAELFPTAIRPCWYRRRPARPLHIAAFLSQPALDTRIVDREAAIS